MLEHELQSREDLKFVYDTISTRNTAGTLMNDSSSRSHCFAFLTLRLYDRTKDTVRTSRFQFCDLAGTERMKEAHGIQSWLQDETGEGNLHFVF